MKTTRLVAAQIRQGPHMKIGIIIAVKINRTSVRRTPGVNMPLFPTRMPPPLASPILKERGGQTRRDIAGPCSAESTRSVKARVRTCQKLRLGRVLDDGWGPDNRPATSRPCTLYIPRISQVSRDHQNRVLDPTPHAKSSVRRGMYTPMSRDQN